MIQNLVNFIFCHIRTSMTKSNNPLATFLRTQWAHAEYRWPLWYDNRITPLFLKQQSPFTIPLLPRCGRWLWWTLLCRTCWLTSCLQQRFQGQTLSFSLWMILESQTWAASVTTRSKHPTSIDWPRKELAWSTMSTLIRFAHRTELHY